MEIRAAPSTKQHQCGLFTNDESDEISKNYDQSWKELEKTDSITKVEIGWNSQQPEGNIDKQTGDSSQVSVLTHPQMPCHSWSENIQSEEK